MNISVIVPVYNTSQYLYQCLQSLKEQTLKDIEVICINDGSTDESLDIIMTFVNDDERFKVINKENTGYGNSMNIGLQKARGDYIGIVESDDFAELDMFEKLFSAAEQYNPDIVKGNYNECDRHGICKKVGNLDEFPYNQAITSQKYPNIFRAHPSIWTSIYKREFLEENEVQFLETPGASFQDISFSFKALHSASSIVCLSDGVLNYRVENSSSSIYNPDKIYCVCDELEEMRRFISKRFECGRINQDAYKFANEIVDWLLYSNYMWNYSRLQNTFKCDFLRKTRDAFLDMSEETFKNSLWSENDIEIVNAVTKSFGLYYNLTTQETGDSRLKFFDLINNQSLLILQRAFNGFVEDSGKVSIYGAGQVGEKVYQYLKDKNLHGCVKNFVVSKKNVSMEMLDGIPIVQISELSDSELSENLFVVSVSSKFQLEILKILEQYGAKNIFLVDQAVRTFIK